MTAIDNLRKDHEQDKADGGLVSRMWKLTDIDALFAHIDMLQERLNNFDAAMSRVEAELAAVTAERDGLRVDEALYVKPAEARTMPVSEAYTQQDKFHFAFGITPIERIEKSSARIQLIDSLGYRDVDVYLLFGPNNNGTKLSPNVTLFIVGDKPAPAAPAPTASDTRPLRKPAPPGAPKDEGIDLELASQGLRRASVNEAGWYAYTSYGTVWATDLPLPDHAIVVQGKPTPAQPPAAPEAAQAAPAVKLTAKQRDALEKLAKSKGALFTSNVNGFSVIHIKTAEVLVNAGYAEWAGQMQKHSQVRITPAGRAALEGRAK